MPPVASRPSSDKGDRSRSIALSNRNYEAQSIFICRLQTVIHSIMSARIVFHVVNTTSKDISHAESALEALRTQYYLSTQIEMESVVVSTLNGR